MPRATVVASPAAARSAPAGATAALQRYRDRRDFSQTPEPADTSPAAPRAQPRFVIQKHDATRLHYDFRLELGGVLLSWAVPKGPSLDPAVKRMAVRTEDHPLAYADFEGRIPAGQYGAGHVIVWDRGHWRPAGDPQAGLAAGKLAFELQGEKLAGHWELVRLKPREGEKQEAWLLFKKRDPQARSQADYDVVQALPDSVLKAVPAAKPKPTPKRAAASRRSKDGAPPGARAAALPETLAPQLAVLASAVPRQGRWIYETKFDGYRLLVRIEGGVPRLITRGGHDWTDRMPALADALASLQAGSAWLDGEIVVSGAPGPGASGGGDFSALQNAFDRTRTPQRRAERGGPPIEYFVFDLLYFEGHDLRDAPLYARQALLRQWLQPQLQGDSGPLHLSLPLGEGGGDLADGLLQQACAARLEGLIAKRADAPHRGTRSTDWLKLKCQQRQEFVVGGFIERSDDASAVGSLLLGVHDAQGRLQHAGKVGTGWDRAAAQALRKDLSALASEQSPFEAGSVASTRWSRARGAAGAGRVHWVRPRTVVEVSFGEWTPAGHIRHASFIAVRSDKPARAIVREEPAAETDMAPTQTRTATTRRSSGPAAPAASPRGTRDDSNASNASNASAALKKLKVSHPERIIDSTSGHTKLDLVRYYDRVAEFMLPHLARRPVALVRAPGGVGGSTFFQKHIGRTALPGVRELDPALWPGHDPLLEVHTHAALLGAAQMNVIEFHTGNSTTKNITKPDRMVFDLDPGEGVGWPAIREGALLTRTLLSELGLQSWLKTSGGKGLHLVVPLTPRWDFTTVKAFSKAVVEHLSQHVPERFVARSGPAHRKGRIFVDYLRNGEGATTVAALSARARPGLGVSMPIDWDELPGVKAPDAWTIGNAHEHLSRRGADPWAALAGVRQSLVGPMKALGFRKPAP